MARAGTHYARKGGAVCVNKAYDCDIAIAFKDEAEAVTEGELKLIRVYLPEILKELAMLTNKDEE